MKNPKLWILLVAIASVAHLAWCWPQVPDPVATHFGPGGKADGWMSKAAFLRFELGMLAFIPALFLSLSALLRRLPNDAINMPNREFWLAPERRAASLARLESELLAFGVALGIFFFGVQDSLLRANISRTFRLDGLFFVYLVGLLTYTLIWCLGFYRRWRTPGP